MNRMSFALLGLVGALALAAAPSAEAARSGVKVGTLRCVVAPGVGLILGSSKEVSCTFSGDGRTERYRGSTGKLGIDIGVTGKSYLAWAVFAPGRVGPHALAGTYVGASAQATAGAGLGANVLVGNGQRGINLQPISVQAQSGLNVAGGLASLTLN